MKVRLRRDKLTLAILAPMMDHRLNCSTLQSAPIDLGFFFNESLEVVLYGKIGQSTCFRAVLAGEK